MTALVLTTACSLMLALQWADVASAYQRQSVRYAQTISSFADKYLSGYAVMLDETLNRMQISQQYSINGELRHWLSERFSNMPDARAIVYADMAGNYIRLPNVELSDDVKKEIDPQSKIWYTEAALDPFNNIHYTSSQDIFENGHKTLTLSKTLVNPDDGNKMGVLAIRLNIDSSKYVLNTLYSPLPGKTWLIDGNGHQVDSANGEISPQALKALSAQKNPKYAFFYLPEKDCWYFYSAIGNTGWFIMHEVVADELRAHVLSKSVNVLFCMFFTLIALLICWWSVRSVLNQLSSQIANGIRNGNIEQKLIGRSSYDESQNTTRPSEESQYMAFTDPLTGLKNRRAFNNDIESVLPAAEPGLAIINVDNTKQINATYGNTTGDVVLKAVADLGMRLRGLDNITLYRYSGDEIAVLFQGMDQQQAYDYLESWRETCLKRRFREEDLLVSFSGALCMKKKRSANETIAQVENRLKDAKAAGKNQIVSESDS